MAEMKAGLAKKHKTKSKKHKKDYIRLKDVPLDVIESIAATIARSRAKTSSISDKQQSPMALDEYKQLPVTHSIDVLADNNLAVDGCRHKTPVKLLEELRTKCLLDFELAFRPVEDTSDNHHYLCALGSICTSGQHATSARAAKHASALAMLRRILPSLTTYFQLVELAKRNPRLIVKKGKFLDVTPRVNGKVPEGPRPPCKFPAMFASASC